MMTKGKKVDQRIKEENENETNNIKNINGKTNLCMKNKMYCTSQKGKARKYHSLTLFSFKL